MDAERELSLVDLAARSLKARLRTLLASNRGRTKFLNTLYHHPPFDSRYVWRLPYEESNSAAVYANLVAYGAPEDCYVMSASSEYDGTTIRLDDAVAAVGEATILICIPGRLAYYVGEDELEQWIVYRAP